ncbi:translationally-controlled tumor [Fusarium heterosporum]|uniref:Translationally-controlled tumor protein homolog n=1 Tax=Fusarium heterosporum TaxID=42747 RepID=A0A8H5WP76_FUSHE|nr:translationally-controlled tumor [Fusarium heterosporum]
MVIYKDILTGDVMISDAFPIQEVQSVVYEVDCSMVKIEGAEELDGDDDLYVNNVVHSFKLQPTSVNKRSYEDRLKSYFKFLLWKLGEQGRDQTYIAEFQKNAQAYAKGRILSHFDDYEFYTGESVEDGGMIVLMNYREDGETPYLTFWKHGLEEIHA